MQQRLQYLHPSYHLDEELGAIPFHLSFFVKSLSFTNSAKASACTFAC
jgi:hypothetical protein